MTLEYRAAPMDNNAKSSRGSRLGEAEDIYIIVESLQSDSNLMSVSKIQLSITLD